MPWIAIAKLDFKNYIVKDEPYIVGLYKHNKNIVTISTILNEYIINLPPSRCKQIFHSPTWVKE